MADGTGDAAAAPTGIGVRHGVAARRYRERALAIWPGLDHHKLSRAGNDPWRIARIVAHRSGESLEVIVSMLTCGPDR